jgi:hypothetical protein
MAQQAARVRVGPLPAAISPGLVVLACAYVGLRLYSFVGIVGHASSFPDTVDYERTERLSVFGLDFWTWFKPWGTPLLWKLLPGSTSTSAPIAQWMLSVVAWLVLAYAVYRTLEERVVKYVGFGIVLAFSLVPAVAVWDGALLSESLSLSLTALLLAAMLFLLRSPSWSWAVAVLVLAFFFAGTRTTNGYLLPFLLVPLAAVIFRRGRWVAAALVAASFLVAGITYASANVREWEVPLGEIIAGRVLQRPSEEAYFVTRGMPVRPSLAQDIWANRSPEAQFETTPALAWFRPWFVAQARGVYTDYLVSHPGVSIGDPIRNLGLMVSPSSSTTDLQALPVGFYAASGFRSAMPSFLNRVFYPSNAGLVLVWTVFVLVLVAGFALMGWGRLVWAVPLVVLASTVPHAIIVWDGDDASTGRHALILAVLLRFGLFLISLYLLDAYLRNRSAPSAPPQV